MRPATLVTAARGIPLGLWVMAVLCLGSSWVLLRGGADREDALSMWVFSPTHQSLYEAYLAEHPEDRVDLRLMSIPAIERRMMSGFFSGLPTADLIEAERAVVGRAFTGPIEAVGFLDLTDRLAADGLLEQINPPSFSPWTSRGRVFGLPHDVHPVMLAYRADLTDAAGIDLSGVETWEELFTALRPMMSDADGNGEPDRWALAFWYTHIDNLEVLLLQGGGRLFDEQGRPTIDDARNAEILAEIVSWCGGASRVAADVEDFSAAGHQQRIEGYAIAYLCPDWMCSIWKEQVPQIGGKMRLMPLPAFERGGRRTSVRGGTMLGVPRDGPNAEAAYEQAKRLYTDPEIARKLYAQADIIPPFRSLWSDPIFDEPDPFFMGQRKGRMFIELAPEVPVRSSSPYNRQALLLLRDAAVTVAERARAGRLDGAEALRPVAEEALADAQRAIVRAMARNAFAGVRDDEEAKEGEVTQ
jgi:arabinosaccharide transport system substrate-binding protein